MNKLLKEIEDFVTMSQQLEHFKRGDLSDLEVCEGTLHVLFGHYEEDLTEITLRVDKMRKAQERERRIELKSALFSFMNAYYSISISVNSGDIKELKKYYSYHESKEGIDFYLRIGVALFPHGTDDFGNIASKWLHSKILTQVMANIKDLEEGGESHDFVKRNNFYPFIRAIVDNR